MEIIINVDGNETTGHYRVTCDCRDTWAGTGSRFGVRHFSPALPIAEAAAHHHMEHPDRLLHLTWSNRFGHWLRQHWELVSAAELNFFLGMPSD